MSEKVLYIDWIYIRNSPILSSPLLSSPLLSYIYLYICIIYIYVYDVYITIVPSSISNTSWSIPKYEACAPRGIDSTQSRTQASKGIRSTPPSWAELFGLGNRKQMALFRARIIFIGYKGNKVCNFSWTSENIWRIPMAIEDTATSRNLTNIYIYIYIYIYNIYYNII